MEHLYEKAQESAEYIKAHTTKRPKIAVVLGSGLGNLTADFTETEELPYKDAAVDEQAALDDLETFAQNWDNKYPKIAKSWRENWANLST